MTSATLMERTGISKAEFNHLRARRIILATEKSAAGWMLFAEDTVAKVLRYMGSRIPKKKRDREEPDYSTHQAIEVFKLLDQGERRDRILVKLEMHPLVLEAIHRRWVTMTEGLFIRKHVLDAIHKLVIDGACFPLQTDNDLADLLETIAKDQQCPSCGKTRNACASCVTQKAREVFAKEQEAREAAREALLEADEQPSV